MQQQNTHLGVWRQTQTTRPLWRNMQTAKHCHVYVVPFLLNSKEVPLRPLQDRLRCFHDSFIMFSSSKLMCLFDFFDRKHVASLLSEVRGLGLNVPIFCRTRNNPLEVNESSMVSSFELKENTSSDSHPPEYTNRPSGWALFLNNDRWQIIESNSLFIVRGFTLGLSPLQSL